MNDESAADDHVSGLDHALAGLARLVSGDSTLKEVLATVATLATTAIPGADGAGVTMSESGRPDTIAASATFVRDVDAIQYRLGEGPCISAVAEQRTTRSGALGTDPAWPHFGPLAGALGINSVVSLPLMLADEVLGSLNVYAFTLEAFTGDGIQTGQQFAVPAAVSIHNARRLEQAERLTHELQTALINRAVIDQAIGIIRARSGLTADDAFTRLRILSQRDEVKLSVVATGIVNEAVARARARGTSAGREDPPDVRPPS